MRMRSVKFNGHKVELYDSVQDLPVSRFQIFNLNLLIDSGIGGDMDGFIKRAQMIRGLIKNDDKEGASREVSNMVQNVVYITERVNPEMAAFCALIYRLDGRLIEDEDLSEEGVKELIKELGKKRLLMSKLKEVLRSIKKKVDTEFEVFFPTMNDSAKVKEYYSALKRRTGLVLRGIKGFDVESQIKSIDEFLMSRVKVKNYFGAKGLQVQMIKRFEEMCILLNQYKVSSDSKKMTTLAFYQSLEAIKSQVKKNKK